MTNERKRDKEMRDRIEDRKRTLKGRISSSGYSSFAAIEAKKELHALEWLEQKFADEKKRADRLAESLEFYADPETYFAVGFLADPPCGELVEDFSETELGIKPGKRARAALGQKFNG